MVVHVVMSNDGIRVGNVNGLGGIFTTLAERRVYKKKFASYKFRAHKFAPGRFAGGGTIDNTTDNGVFSTHVFHPAAGDIFG